MTWLKRAVPGWVAPMCALLMSAALIGFGWVQGAQHAEAELEIYKLQQQAATDKAVIRAAQKTANLWRYAMTLEEVRQDELRKAADRERVGLERLRDRPDRVSRDPAACAGSTGAELARGDGQFLVRYAADVKRLEVALDKCEAQYGKAEKALKRQTERQSSEAVHPTLQYGDCTRDHQACL